MNIIKLFVHWDLEYRYIKVLISYSWKVRLGSFSLERKAHLNKTNLYCRAFFALQKKFRLVIKDFQ